MKTFEYTITDELGIHARPAGMLVKAGGALIDNMAWLFVIGVAVGLSDDRDGTSALAGLVSWLMMTNLLSTGVVTTLMPAIADDPVKTLAFDKIQNVFIAIIAGIIGSACYNRFKNAKLPDWLAFFSGKRCVAIVTGLVSIVVSVVLLFVWPIIFGALVSVGEAIIGMEGIGAGIYAFLNRLLIPTGLHHALNNVFWFDTIGLGDLSHYWAGDVTGQNGVTWSLGMYMSGFFPCMMFGVFGAALAMIKTAKNKKAAIGLVLSAAICAFICGVTEPFEFGFMFLCFPLYCICSSVRHLHRHHLLRRLPRRLLLLRRRDRPRILVLPAGGEQHPDDHPARHRGIRRILSGILLRDHQVQPQDPGP